MAHRNSNSVPAFSLHSSPQQVRSTQLGQIIEDSKRPFGGRKRISALQHHESARSNDRRLNSGQNSLMASGRRISPKPFNTLKKSQISLSNQKPTHPGELEFVDFERTEREEEEKKDLDKGHISPRFGEPGGREDSKIASLNQNSSSRVGETEREEQMQFNPDTQTEHSQIKEERVENEQQESYRLMEPSQMPNDNINSLNNQNQQMRVKRKKLAKDDSCQLFTAFAGPFGSSKFNNQTPLMRGLLFDSSPSLFDEEKKNQQPRQTLVRKRSATSLNQMTGKLDTNSEDENEYIELAQSLMTLRIEAPLGLKRMHTMRERRSVQKKSTLNQSQPYFERQRNVKQSNQALGSLGWHGSEIEDDSDEEFTDTDEDEKEEESDSSEDFSVSLEDFQLRSLGKPEIRLESPRQFVFKMTQAIQEAEEMPCNKVEERKMRGRKKEEYESLVLGQSIWSTDMPKQSRQQFIRNINQFSSGQNQQKSDDRERSDSDNCEFEALNKNIVRETQNIAPNEEFFTHTRKPGRSVNHNQYLKKDVIFQQNTDTKIKRFYPTTNFLQIAQEFKTSSNRKIKDHLEFSRVAQNHLMIPKTPIHQYLGQNYQSPNLLQGSHQDELDQVSGNAIYPNYHHQFQTQLSFANEFKQKSGQTITSGISVHSGIGMKIRTKRQEIGMLEFDQYQDNTSSNYTHHPYSMYDQSILQQSKNKYHHQMLEGGAGGQNQFGLNSQGSRAHIFINRQINKHMMNPIYKSKQTLTSLQMNKFVGVPWRGGSSQMNLNMNTQIQQHAYNPHPQYAVESQVLSSDQFANIPSHHLSHYLQQDSHLQQDPNLQSAGMMPHFSEYDGDSNLQQHNAEGYQTAQSQFDEGMRQDFEQTKWSDYPADTQQSGKALSLKQSALISLNAKPFYPKNYGENKPTYSILAGGQLSDVRQKQKMPMQVPVPIPVVRQPKPKHFLDNDQLVNKQGQSQNENQIFIKTFYGEQILSKKNELDQKLKETTENLESKLIRAAEINIDDDEEGEEDMDQITFEVTSTNNGMSIRSSEGEERRIQKQNKRGESKEVNHIKIKQYEERIKRKNERAEIFRKLQDQVIEFKSKMFDSTPENTASPGKVPDTIQEVKVPEGQSKLAPFKPDAQQYMDKVLSLMKIINEVDELTNVAELKNKIEKQKLQILKARAEKDNSQSQVSDLHLKLQELQREMEQKEYSYNIKSEEEQNINQALNQTLEQVRETKDYLERENYELSQQMERLRQENQELIIQNQRLEDQMQENDKIVSQQLSNLQQQNEQLETNIYALHSQNQNLQAQVENLTAQHFQTQQNFAQKEAEINLLNSQLSMAESELKKVKQQSRENQDEDCEEIPLKEQLENANHQIKSLQDYIKKRSVEEVKQAQARQEMASRKEGVLQQKYNQLRKDIETKDKMIQKLNDQINHPESLPDSTPENPSKDIPVPKGSLGIGEDRRAQNLTIFDQSSISDTKLQLLDNTQEKHEQEHLVKAMTPECLHCMERDSYIRNMEAKLSLAIQQIQRQQITINQQMAVIHDKKPSLSASTQTDLDISTYIQPSSHPFDANSAKFGVISQGIQNSKSYQMIQMDQRSNRRADYNHQPFSKSSSRILFNNLLRQLKLGVDNLQIIDQERIKDLKTQLDDFMDKHAIHLLIIDQLGPDPTQITHDFVFLLIKSTFEFTQEVLQDLQGKNQGYQWDQGSELTRDERQHVDLGMTMSEFKEMQHKVRIERQSCHRIIVEVERLLYEMTNILQSPSFDLQQCLQLFGYITTTYLDLPLHLKPIFDHCKQIESKILLTLKSHDSAISQFKNGGIYNTQNNPNSQIALQNTQTSPAQIQTNQGVLQVGVPPGLPPYGRPQLQNGGLQEERISQLQSALSQNVFQDIQIRQPQSTSVPIHVLPQQNQLPVQPLQIQQAFTGIITPPQLQGQIPQIYDQQQIAQIQHQIQLQQMQHQFQQLSTNPQIQIQPALHLNNLNNPSLIPQTGITQTLGLQGTGLNQAQGQIPVDQSSLHQLQQQQLQQQQLQYMQMQLQQHQLANYHQQMINQQILNQQQSSDNYLQPDATSNKS